MVGGNAWNNLPRMFNHMETDFRRDVLNYAALYLQIYFGDTVAEWYMENWMFTDEWMLPIMRNLKTASAELAANTLTVSRAVLV